MESMNKIVLAGGHEGSHEEELKAALEGCCGGERDGAVTD